MSREVRALVLTGFGINCDRETAHALSLAGAAAERVHISQLTGHPGQPPTHRLGDYGILVFDGGFSWGDDHGAGVLLANRLGNHLRDDLAAFLERGGLVLGICNGFQALVNLGLLPMLEGRRERTVALAGNDCGNFQDRWVGLAAEPGSPCRFTRGLKRLELPVRHGEGKLVAERPVLEALERRGLVALRYATAGGKPAGGRFPHNPNGSAHDIAGLCDPSGRVFGLMPHPEGFYRLSQHPTWTRRREQARRRGRELEPFAAGQGLAIFANAVAAAREAA
jgi:phosphoribosylformylglycinamidine synthase